MNNRRKEQGIGIVEVLLALAILLYVVLSISKIQSTGVINARLTANHFSLDYLSNNIVDMLRANTVTAKAGEFNFDAETDTAVPVHSEAVAWKNKVADSLPGGLGAINCSVDSCNIAISWMEDIDGRLLRQYYRTRTPL